MKLMKRCDCSMQNPYMEDFAYANLCRRQGTKVPIKFAGTGKAW